MSYKPQEYWICRGDSFTGEPDYIYQSEPFGTHSSKTIRVIEHAAYENIKIQRDKAITKYGRLVDKYASLAHKYMQALTKVDEVNKLVKTLEIISNQDKLNQFSQNKAKFLSNMAKFALEDWLKFLEGEKDE